MIPVEKPFGCAWCLKERETGEMCRVCVWENLRLTMKSGREVTRQEEGNSLVISLILARGISSSPHFTPPSFACRDPIVTRDVSGRKWVQSKELGIVMRIRSWAGVIYLRYTVLSNEKDETAQSPLLSGSCFIGSCYVGASKRLSHSISLAVYCLLSYFIFSFSQ